MLYLRGVRGAERADCLMAIPPPSAAHALLAFPKWIFLNSTLFGTQVRLAATIENGVWRKRVLSKASSAPELETDEELEFIIVCDASDG